VTVTLSSELNIDITEIEDAMKIDRAQLKWRKTLLSVPSAFLSLGVCTLAANAEWAIEPWDILGNSSGEIRNGLTETEYVKSTGY
jgi:hypothetical protein